MARGGWAVQRLPASHRALVMGFLFFVVFGVATGFADVLASLALTGAPFAVVGRLVTAGQWPGVFAYILGHNMGLACVVPALGLTLVRRYPEPTRLLALRTLLAACGLALVWGLVLFRVPKEPAVVLLFGLEAAGVLLLAVPSYVRLRGAADADLRAAVPRLAPWAVAAFGVLAAAAFYETLLVAGVAPLRVG